MSTIVPTLDRETSLRAQIAALLFVMTNAVLFGAGLVTVLLMNLSAQATGIGIAAVIVLSAALAAPAAWFIAPRLRAGYWRARERRAALALHS